MRKNILLTGCSRGVGLETTKILINKGYNVYGVSRKLTDEYKELLTAYPKQVFFKSYDLVNVVDIQKDLFKNFISNSTPLHGFINNAALAYDDIITNLNIDKLNMMYKVNVFSPLNITKYAIRNMIYNRINGSIIHISSISVHTGYKGLAMYASSKGCFGRFFKKYSTRMGRKRDKIKLLSCWFYGY